MNKLIEKLKDAKAIIRPVKDEEIRQAELDLNISFSEEYKNYLRTFGIISLGATEVYGLGVSKTSYLNIYTTLTEIRKENNFPSSAVPLSDIGDGHSYIYDNESGNILVWASPNGGIVKEYNIGLEEFLISLLFN